MHETMIRLYFLTILFLGSSHVLAADPALPGYHPLTQSQAGSVLITELRCAACHADIQTKNLPEKTAPDLSEVGSRVSAEYLQRYLTSPLTVQPGTTMPDLLASKSESEKQEIAKALTHFLVAQSKPSSTSVPVKPFDTQQGKVLFHSVGCVACHGPQDEMDNQAGTSEQLDEDELYDELLDFDPKRAARKDIKPIAISLEHVSGKYSLKSLSEFLFQPLKVRNSGRMPDMKLTPAEALDIAGYLIGDRAQEASSFAPDATLVEKGRKQFQELNCAACHSLPDFEAAAPRSALRMADLFGGCLSEDKRTKDDVTAANGNSPRFDLNADQIAAIAKALEEDRPDESDNIILAQTLTALRCIACHVRDEYGGVHDSHNEFFKGSEVNLGDDGRIPPPLTLLGAKLQPTWLKKVLYDGESVRFYMATRMPLYGQHNLKHLPDLFARLDNLTGPELNVPAPERRTESEREQEKLIRAAGRELLGDKGANCITCHRFNGKAAQLNQGIDLLTSTERLQPAWFYHYLINPGAFRTRTVMPSAWPDGKAAYTNILDGDTERQIEAIWYYLSLGTSAADPPGVRSTSTKLVVGDHAVVYRGRSRVAGFRGIAVGLPGNLNYAFNAETGTLSAIWAGEFVGVNWSGQGSGDFNPASRAITLAQDVSFATLADKNASWPLMPVMTKENPVNPDPLYPKNHGYQFRGYFLDNLGVPTFQYRSGSIEINDKSLTVDLEDNTQLQRTLKFSSPSPQTIWFRALTGDIERESENAFRTSDLRLVIPSMNVILRSMPDIPQQSELLLRLDVPQGESTLEIQYEPLQK